MSVSFEHQRFYVANRRSVLFFARVAGRRLRCYVEQGALIESPRALRDQRDMYQRALIAFDERRSLVEATARDLILSGAGDLASALVISAGALQRETAEVA